AHTALSFWPYPSDSEDSLTILIGSTILDKVKYNYNWYRDYNKSFGGWSLERIDLDNLCARDSNWIASRDPRGGTPGRTNSVAGIWRDQYPPGLLAMRFPSSSQIELLFSETLDTTYMKDLTRYTLSGGLSVASVSVKSEREILLQLSAPLASGVSYSIQVDAKDCVGNRGAIQRNFGLPEPAQPYDVVFTEIMADPFPQVGLPGYEYIEIHNRTNKFINLQGWRLVVGFSSVDSLSFFLLPPQGYLVLTSVEGARALQLYGYANVLGLSYFPGVPNQGAALRLEAIGRRLIDRVTYNESWYRNPNKQFGGWSLERIWIEWACGEAANWQASESPRGGTPGLPNAFRPSAPPPAPSIVQLYYQHPVITLRFSERLDTILLADITRYRTEPALPFVGVKPIDGGAGVELVPMIPLEEGRVYQLILTGLRNCQGDTVPLLKGEFFMVSPVQPGDVVINEILANTEIGGSRYVELYNRSRKIIDLSQLMLAKGKDKYSFAEIASIPVYLKPGEHIALAYDTADVRRRYQPPAEARLWPMSYFPSYYYRGDTVWLLRLRDTVVIDVAPYVPEWHFSDLRNQRGVALERLSPDRPSFERSNWYSASSKVRYGTPGYRNSQRELQPEETAEGVRIEPKTIFPDGDGHKDFAWVYVPEQQPDTRVDITIYTLSGHIVRKLVQAHLLAVGENAFRWEGTDDEGKRLPSGIYIVEVKISKPTQGEAQQYRLACALAEKP
ncbi:MAG: lamin tail domain-containing protein, partial [Bacteroidia bacterium]|nr:lamin tail domain-containing protein [Bacteroidia bacterium]